MRGQVLHYGGGGGGGNVRIVTPVDTDPLVAQAINEIYSTYGVKVSVDEKKKSLLKFGRNETVSTAGKVVMTLPGTETEETLVTDNDITHIASSSGSDTEPCIIEGHTVDGNGDFTFVVQTATLAGQTKTALTTPLARVTRVYNNGTSDLVGTVYVAEDVTFTAGVPQTDSAIHIMIPAGKNQSEKCATTLSSTDYWIITKISGSVLEKSSGIFADIELQVKQNGKVWRPRSDIATSSGNTTTEAESPYIIAPANSDVRMFAVASASNTDCAASANGFLAKVVN